MDDNEATPLDRLLAVKKQTERKFVEVIDLTQEEAHAFRDISEMTSVELGRFRQQVAELTSSMDAEREARSKRRRFVRTVGLLAAILGVYLLWDSSRIGAGFHQTAAVAAGGALITFVLVELMLHSIVELPTREAKKREEQVNGLKKIVKEMGQKYQELSVVIDSTIRNSKERETTLAPYMQQLREGLTD